jgi:membrane protease subunit HflK
MPWQNDNNGSGPQNPWGSGGGGGPRRGGGGGEPPQFDEFIKKGQDQLKNVMPGGKGGISIAILIAVILWVFSGVYFVDPNEEAVVMRFGKFVEQTGPGASWHLPYPIETVEIRGVTDEKQIAIGIQGVNARNRGRSGVPSRDESLMLTQDENIVDVRFNVVWRIGSLRDYLFNMQDPDGTIKAVAESAMREIVGNKDITPIITTARGEIEAEAIRLIQDTLNTYGAGVDVLRVQIIESQAPEEVKDAFLDVQRAEADQQRFQNEAEAYRNQIVREAEGRAEQLIQLAEGYRATTVAGAQGEAARFVSVYNEYVQAKDVTKKRIYLETMEGILAGMDKIILDGQAGSGVVPYLPINELGKKTPATQGGN